MVREAEETLQAKKVKVQTGKKTTEKSNGNVNPKSSYKKFTYEQKVALFNLAPHMSYAKIEAKFGVDEATFRGWVKNGVNEDQRKHNGKIGAYEKVEEQLYQVLLKKRENGNAVTANTIYQEMKALLLKQYGINNQEYQSKLCKLLS